jgi:hypothetical protein
VVLAAGTCAEDEHGLYPESALAARYGASADKETPDAKEAYASFEPYRRARPADWRRLPWA